MFAAVVSVVCCLRTCFSLQREKLRLGEGGGGRHEKMRKHEATAFTHHDVGFCPAVGVGGVQVNSYTTVALPV